MLLFCLAVAACGGKPDAGEIVLTYGSQYSPNHPFSRADIAWMDFVHEQSNGAIRIKPYWGGGLLSADESMLEVRHGVVDIGLVTPIYTRGGTHLLRIQSGFYSGADSIAEQVAVYRCLEKTVPQIGR